MTPGMFKLFDIVSPPPQHPYKMIRHAWNKKLGGELLFLGEEPHFSLFHVLMLFEVKKMVHTAIPLALRALV